MNKQKSQIGSDPYRDVERERETENRAWPAVDNRFSCCWSTFCWSTFSRFRAEKAGKVEFAAGDLHSIWTSKCNYYNSADHHRQCYEKDETAHDEFVSFHFFFYERDVT